MSRRLAQSLIADGRVRSTEVEEALQRQVVFGGSLDTNLLEAGAIEEAPLLEALARAFALPAVGKDAIDAIGPHIPRLFPLPFAETYHLVPYKLEGTTLGVLVNGAPDGQLFERIRERLQLNLQPHITSEVRLHY